MSRSLRLWLLLLCLLGAQLAAAAHGLEHARSDADASPHACLVCLAGHGLEGALPTPLLSPVPLPGTAASPFSLPVSPALPAVVRHAHARAPPRS